MAFMEVTEKNLTLVRAPIADGQEMLERGLVAAAGREGQTSDLVNAHKWFNLAASKGCVPAVQYRKEISNEMTRCEIVEAQRLARDWLQNAGCN
ncbi:hypothetical protein [Polycladidibacter stylochi]|uniref:hypothetical protein n=1 Tax=Polycladidibacter stylochi TaxID=1807766 RepID=UPI00083057FF|nr:hypothetical protein [Pseudovibrio stylochi]